MKLVFSVNENFVVLCNKPAIVREGSGYPGNGISMGMPVLG